MTDRIRVCRPEDLLVAELELVNVAVAADGASVSRVAAGPAYVVMHLPPQHVAEPWFGEEKPVGGEHPRARSAAAGESRLVFELRDGTDSVALGTRGLLASLLAGEAWAVVPGIAGHEPVWDTDTSIEAPTRMLLAPGHDGIWVHRAEPFGVHGRAELWHTTFTSTRPDGQPATVSAVGVISLQDIPGLPTAPTPQEMADIVALCNRSDLDGVPHQPAPLTARRLTLSALGASVHLTGAWTLPVGAPGQAPPVHLDQYEQVIGQGRDQFVKVSRPGYLSSGHRAALVTVTERIFETVGVSGSSFPGGSYTVATSLRQYHYVVPTEPEVDFAALADGFPYGGREMPLRTLRIVCDKTPHLDDADVSSPFWVRAGGRDFEFPMEATDWEGNRVSLSMPLFFIPEDSIEATQHLLRMHNGGDQSRRSRPLHGQRFAVADPGDRRGETSAVVDELVFELVDATGRRDALPSSYRLGFVLSVADFRVRLDAVEHFTGNRGSVQAHLHPAYRDGGMSPAANPRGAFLELRERIPLRFRPEQVGALARPDTFVDTVTSELGVAAADFVASAASGSARLDPAALFGNAKLFGVFDLIKLLDADADLVPPVLRTVRLPDRVETRYRWTPATAPADEDALVTVGEGGKLLLEAVLVRRLDGGDGGSTVTGELTNVTLRFLGVVDVHFDRMAFKAVPGAKPDLTAEGCELEFLGPLQFVNTLRDILPNDGFSDPPAVRVTPAGITAGYTLGVPSVGVGVFSLSNLALVAGLSVPFDNRPALLRFAISERHHPFGVAVSLFGGGGFFALAVSAAGIEQVEAAIEFGGAVSLNLGVASGGVAVMAGIYFSMQGESVLLAGYLRIGGHLSVLGLVGITVEFYMALGYRTKESGGGEVWGQASLSVSVKIAFFSKTVRLTVERSFAGAAGDPSFADCVDAADWDEYCLAFAG